VRGAVHSGLRLASDIVWSLDAGITITIVLAIIRASHIALGVTDVLLRPSFYLLPFVYGQRTFSSAVFVFSDVVIYGSLAFVGLRLWPIRERLGLGGSARAERRRGSRVALDAPVCVYGWLEDEPFAESTETVNVGELGGLIPLSVKVVPSQELVLTNLQTEQDMRCRVIRSITREDGRTLAGVVFLQAAPSFWQIEFLSRAPSSNRREKADRSVAGVTSG
jgi:hypothetical protein